MLLRRRVTSVNVFESIWRKDKRQEGFLPIESFVPKSAAPTSTSGDWRFIARQAIFDSSTQVFGYELLARSGWENRFMGDSDTATRKMIFDGALYGFEGLTRGRRAFINVLRRL